MALACASRTREAPGRRSCFGCQCRSMERFRVCLGSSDRFPHERAHGGLSVGGLPVPRRRHAEHPGGERDSLLSVPQLPVVSAGLVHVRVIASVRVWITAKTLSMEHRACISGTRLSKPHRLRRPRGGCKAGPRLQRCAHSTRDSQQRRYSHRQQRLALRMRTGRSVWE